MSKVLIWSVALYALVTANDFFLPYERDFPDVVEENTARSGEEVYRLPKNVIPMEYDIFIDLYFAERVENPYSYDGREYILIQVRFTCFVNFYK